MTTDSTDKPMHRGMPDDFGRFIARYLPGKIQKISVNAAMPCPNRDGSKGTGGCIYCNNASFSPAYTMKPGTIAAQLEAGKRFFARKYPRMRYLAYFQSYTSTNCDIVRLRDMYQEALTVDGVDGLIIGTRPDCMPDPLLDYLSELACGKFVMVEYGAESAHDRTLAAINRCHTWADTADAVRRTAAAGIPVGLHLIMGLQNESREDMLATIDAVNHLPVNIIKCHQLQIIRGTRLAAEVEAGRIKPAQWDVDRYIDLCCAIIRRLREDIAVERFVSQCPDDMLISPRWGLKNYQFTERLRRRLQAMSDSMGSPAISML